MPKRRGDHDKSSLPASKRARTDDGREIDNDIDAEHNPRSQRSKGKGKERAVSEDRDSSLDEDQRMDDLSDLTDEEEFEAKYGRIVEESFDAKRGVVGGIAEHGIIEKIEMYQFMCHKALVFKFGPQINFIIGHNGSGKSAVLSAITIALGGKSNSTGRGSGLKSFIREGQSVSEVTITLKNQGEEAYKPQEYGKSIVITRRFTKEGSSTWKIKGTKTNNVISTKKEELSAICDHMGIQVDNPLTVLTQDNARVFLSAANMTDKYKFFLRGTLLAQLESEYQTCLTSIHTTAKVLKNKKDTIPDLEQAFRHATDRRQEALQARRQEERIAELKIELAWAHVKVEEKELRKRMDDVEKAKRQLEKIEEKLVTVREALQKAGDEVMNHEADVTALGDIDDLLERKRTLKDELRGHTKRIHDCINNLKAINSDMANINKSIAACDLAIATETDRLAQATQEKREEFARKMEEAQSIVAENQATITELATRKADVATRIKSAKEAEVEKEQEMKTLKRNITDIENDMSQLQHSENNKYAAYGAGMAQAIAKIAQTRWYGDVPLGPLGLHVKVKEPDVWADMLAQQLSAQLTAFAVTDARDRDTVKKILNTFNLRGNQIIIYEKDMFDYSSGEPAPDILTVLRALEIDDPFVERILINRAKIERQILARSRSEGERVLARAGGGRAWSSDRFIIRRFPEGGGSTRHFDQPKRSQMLRNEDNTTRLRHLENERSKLEAQHDPLNQEIQHLKSAFAAAKKEESELLKKDRQAHSDLSRAKQNVKGLQQEAEEDLPVNIQGQQQAKAEAEEEKENLVRQFEDISRLKEEYTQTQKAVEQQLDALNTQINDFDQRKDEVTARVATAVHARVQAEHNVRHYEGKAEETTKIIDAVEVILKQATAKFENWRESASKIGDQVETSRKPEEIQRQRDNLKLALQERENRQGATFDELDNEVKIAEQRLVRAKKDCKAMLCLNELLAASLTVRLKKWHAFQRHMALRCKLVFQYNLSQRGYFGKAKFDHVEGTLELRVQTDDQLANQNASKEKDPNSLSGGEKSFSTVCLLLSLWQTIGCPLRCLDEFDVFMDAVNRRISMKMMIDTANQSDKKQYILITPQDMNNIRIGPTVRVHRMTDPERGQGTLAMS